MLIALPWEQLPSGYRNRVSPRVLHVAQPTTGGVAHYVAPLVADQVRRGWDVAVACPDDGHLADDVRAAGARHISWRAVRSPGSSVGREAAALKRIIGADPPDLVHLHSSKAGLTGRLVLRGKRPCLFQPHGWSWLAVQGTTATASRGWERLGARWCDRLVCVSEAEREVGRAAGLNARWAVVRTGVDLDRFRTLDGELRRAARRRLGLGDGPLAVCVGRLSEAKGQDLLVAAWPKVVAALPTATLALVGDGELKPRIEALPLDGVVLAGTRADVPDWYAAADLVVVPSRWDALSLSLIEAAVTGCSIVATDAPGAAEVLGDSDALVPRGDQAALVAAVVRRLADPAAAAAEGAALAELARPRFDRRRAYGEMAALVEQVLSER